MASRLKKDDFIGITGGKIVVSIPNRLNAIKSLVEHLITDDSEIVTIFYGNGVSEKESKELRAYVQELNDDIEVEVIYGKQEIYSYIISVE